MKPLVLITGAAGGLGTALVRAFETHWRVAAAIRTRDLFESANVIWTQRFDVTHAGAVQEAINDLRNAHGDVDVLINNAGLADDSVIPQMGASQWQSVVNANLKGAFLCSRAVFPGMLRRNSGHILHMGSFAGKSGAKGQANYAAAKAGLIGFMQSLAREGGPHNVRSNVVLPGVLKTAMTRNLTPEQLDALRLANVLQRLNDPAEVAHFVAFLATLRNVSGQVFQLDSRIGPWT